MKRSEVYPMPPFFDRYINIVDDIDIITGLEDTNRIEDLVDKQMLLDLGDSVYAPGKWTIKDILQHIIDNERIQAYRALRFARNDKSILPGYDENLFADNTHLAHATVESLLEEFTVTRQSNIRLFKNFSPQMLQRTGICFNVTVPVLALGFVLIGHQLHHINIIKERYLPLLVTS
ncbi:MAG TPA: DinB family protein [Chitinophagaceae bacterium]|nr:DinB family protein [Chitinophagaceae bacterium]